MSMSHSCEQILDEIRDLPPEQLEQLLQFIRDYKTNVQAGQQPGPASLPSDLAGIWSDMSGEEAEQILQLYRQRETYWTMREVDV